MRSMSNIKRRELLIGATTLMVLGPHPVRLNAAGGIQHWRLYAQSPYGQMHFFVAGPIDQAQSTGTPLVCLHQSPTSGVSYREFQSVVAHDRLVLCPDTAGYGNSDGPLGAATMENYGAALAAALQDLGFGDDGHGPVDVLGFHTGNYIAIELAVQRPELVRRLVMPGIPYYSGEERERRLGQYTKPRPYFSDPDYVGESYRRSVLDADNPLNIERRHELFVSRLLSGPRSHFGFAAVAVYDADPALKRVTQPVLLPILNETLAEPTRNAAKLLADHTMVEMPDYDGLAWYTQPEALADVIRSFLDGGQGPRALPSGSRPNTVKPWRHFSQSRYGQMHFVSRGNATRRPPLLLLHQSPLSGRTFAKLQTRLADDRWVLCPDTAGFGDSDGPTSQPTMSDYGGALVDAIQDLNFQQPVDLFGFHTGSFVATEAAVQAPGLFRRVILCGVPYYPASERQTMQNQFLQPYAFLTDPDYVDAMYKRMIPMDGDSEEQLFQFERFTDRMRAGPNGEWGPRAVFAYDADRGLQSITTPTLLMTFDEVMAEPTRQASELVQNASLVELPDLKMMGFVSHPDRVANAIRDFLDKPLS